MQIGEPPEVSRVDPGDAVVPQEDVLQLIEPGQRRGRGRIEIVALEAADLVVLQVEEPQLAAVSQVRQAAQFVALQLPGRGEVIFFKISVHFQDLSLVEI